MECTHYSGSQGICKDHLKFDKETGKATTQLLQQMHYVDGKGTLSYTMFQDLGIKIRLNPKIFWCRNCQLNFMQSSKGDNLKIVKQSKIDSSDPVLQPKVERPEMASPSKQELPLTQELASMILDLYIAVKNFLYEYNPFKKYVTLFIQGQFYIPEQKEFKTISDKILYSYEPINYTKEEAREIMFKSFDKRKAIEFRTVETHDYDIKTIDQQQWINLVGHIMIAAEKLNALHLIKVF